MKKVSNPLEMAYSDVEKAFDEMKIQRAAIEVFRQFHGVLIVVDFKGRLLFWNRGFEETLGYTPCELHRHNFMNLIAPQDVERTLKAFKEGTNKVGEQNIKEPFINRYVSKNGNLVSLEWNENIPVSDGFIIATAKILG